MTGDNNAEMVAELDRLDAEVEAAIAGGTTAQIALWRQVTALEHWFFIARADEATRALGLVDSKSGAAPLSSVPMSAAVDYVASFGKVGVFGGALDHPRLGHCIPLVNPGPLQGWVEGAGR